MVATDIVRTQRRCGQRSQQKLCSSLRPAFSRRTFQLQQVPSMRCRRRQPAAEVVAFSLYMRLTQVPSGTPRSFAGASGSYLVTFDRRSDRTIGIFARTVSVESRTQIVDRPYSVIEGPPRFKSRQATSPFNSQKETYLPAELPSLAGQLCSEVIASFVFSTPQSSMANL